MSHVATAQSISSPPTSGNVAHVARFVISRGSGLRARSWSTSTEMTAIAEAGAGPSSAIASTSARNEPEIRCERCWTASRSLVSASASRTRNSSGGRQSAAVESTAATAPATISTRTSPASRRFDRAGIV
jgi:hypothetical protein